MNNRFARILKYTVIGIGFISIAIAALIIKFDFENERAWNDYSMLPKNQTMVDRAILGRNSKDITIRLRRLLHDPREGLKRGSLELLCTNKGNIYLLMRVYDTSYLTYNPSATLFTDFRIEDGIRKGSADIRKLDNATRGQYFSNLLSNPLSEEEINSVLQALKEGKKSSTDDSNYISIGIGDTSYGFTNRTNISDVIRVINGCQSIQ